MESETHKVSTEEVIFSSTGGSPTKTKQKKLKKKKKKKLVFTLFWYISYVQTKRICFAGVLHLTIQSGFQRACLIFRVSHQFYVRAGYIQYI